MPEIYLYGGKIKNGCLFSWLSDFPSIIFRAELIIPSALLWRHSSLTLIFDPVFDFYISLLSLNLFYLSHFRTHHTSFSPVNLYILSLLHLCFSFICVLSSFSLSLLFPCLLPSLYRPYSPHHRAAGLYSEALCPLWKIFPGVLQQKR